MERFKCDICGKEFFGHDNGDGQLLCFDCGAELADEVKLPEVAEGDPLPESVLDEFEGGRGDDDE